MHSFSVTSAKIAISHLLLKLDSLDYIIMYIFAADCVGLSLTSST